MRLLAYKLNSQVNLNLYKTYVTIDYLIHADVLASLTP